MAFFGLTALGEQNYFRDNSAAMGMDLSLFSTEDCERALDKALGFRKQGTRAESILVEQIPKYLETLYCGPLVPSWDLELVLSKLRDDFGDEDGTEIPRRNFLAAVAAAQEETKHEDFHQGKVYTPKEYESNSGMREANKQNKRFKYHPKEKFVNPVTSQQRYGWQVGETDFAALDKKCTRRFPKTASEATRFAEAMAAAGSF